MKTKEMLQNFGNKSMYEIDFAIRSISLYHSDIARAPPLFEDGLNVLGEALH
jgi:hypothetical protein